MNKIKKSNWLKSAGAGVVLAGASLGLSSQVMAGPPVIMDVEMEGGCPVQVIDTSHSCPAGLGGKGVSCATPGATPMHWRSSNGEVITIIFKDSVPEGLSQSMGGDSGSVNGVISPGAAAGSYSYSVKGPSCNLDPVVIVTR